MIQKLIFIFSCFILSLYSNAQITYDEVESYLEERVSSYSKDSINYKLLLKVLTNFNKSDKEDEVSEIYKNNIGIAFVISEEYPDITIFPAQYTHKDQKVSLRAIRSTKDKGLTEEMKEYVKIYLSGNIQDLLKVKLTTRLLDNKNEANGIITENENEYVIEEPYSLSLIRGDYIWRYIVSVDKRFNIDKDSRIIVYAFKKTILGKNIFDKDRGLLPIDSADIIDQKELDRVKYPLYHDQRTDEIRELVKELIQKEPYKSDIVLQRINSAFTIPINRYNIKDYVTEFIYLSELYIEPDKEVISRFSYKKDYLLNINHLSVHALADYYFSAEKYDEALAYYEKAIFESPYQDSSGTAVTKDTERIIYDMSKICYLAGRKNEAYGYLVGLILDSQIYNKIAEKDINTYFKQENENKKVFRRDLDKALKTIEVDERDKYCRVFEFRNKKIFFCPMLLPKSRQEYEKNMKDSNFYKSLK